MKLSELKKTVLMSKKLLEESLSVVSYRSDMMVFDSVLGKDGGIGYVAYNYGDGNNKTFSIDISTDGGCLVTCLSSPITTSEFDISDPEYPTKICEFIRNESERTR